jgi:hypothetical protein
MATSGALVLWALPAFPQTNPTGTVSGKVEDQQGLALPGAVVTAQSSVLQGSRTATSSANGDYILPFLPPGDYTVVVELSGFATVRHQARVTIGQTTTVSATLAVSSVSETIEVTAESSADFGQKATLATNYKAELIDKLPTNRTIQSAVALTPGVNESGGPGRQIVISGAMSYQNLFMVNGVVIQDNIRNTPFNLYIEDALQETTTSTAAISAEFGRFGGGVVNAITKSGGNQFSGSFRTTFENDAWRALTPYPNDSTTDDVIPIYEGTLGGPIVRDKLWFFGAARLRDFTETLTTGFTFLNWPHGLNEKRYEGKLTFSPLTNHTFKAAYTWITNTEIGNSFGTIMDKASLVDRELPQDLLSLNYTGVLTSDFFVEAQFSSRHFTFKNSGSQYTDLIQGTLLLDRSRDSARYNSPTFCGVCDDEKRDNINVVLKASYFLSTQSTGSHNVVGGFDMFDDERFANNHQSGSDYRVNTTSAILQGENVFPVLDRSTFIQWTPIDTLTQGNRFRTISFFVNDTWTANRNLTFNVGLRYDKNDGSDATGTPVVKDAAFSPRLAATWDPSGNGTWTVNASFARYVTGLANSVGDSASAGGQPANIAFDYLGPEVNTGNPANPVPTAQALQTLWDWFFANGGTSRLTRGAPSVPGVTSVINDTLKSPSVDEFALGLTRRLGTRGLVRLDGVYRKNRDFYSGRRDLSTGKVTDPNGRVFDLTVTENTNDLERTYKALNFQFAYRPKASLYVGGNYTLSYNEGDVVGENSGSGPLQAGIQNFPEYFDRAWSFPVGYIESDQRHRARVFSTWTLPAPKLIGTFDLGGIYYYNTGQPYGSSGPVDTRPYVTNPGYQNPPATVTYFFQNRDAYRVDDRHQLDLSLSWRRRIGLKDAELFARAVLINAFNGDALVQATLVNQTIQTNNNLSSLARFNPFTQTPVEGVHWQKGSTFGDATSRNAYQTPRTVTFSVGFRF